MRFDTFREQIRALSQGRRIQNPDKVQEIVAQMIKVGFEEPVWRDRAAQIFTHWCEKQYPEQMPSLLEAIWQIKEVEIATQRQEMEQKSKTAVTRKKELNQEIERLILIAAIQRLQADPHYTATAKFDEAKIRAEQREAEVTTLETALQERLTSLKGSLT